jgi:hypothetical protein
VGGRVGMLVWSVRRAVAVVIAVRVAEMEGREAPVSRRVVRRGVGVGDAGGRVRVVGVEKFMVGGVAGGWWVVGMWLMLMLGEVVMSWFFGCLTGNVVVVAVRCRCADMLA